MIKKNAKVIYECHQITKLKKALVNVGLKSDNAKVIALTDDIKKELQPYNEANEIVGMGRIVGDGGTVFHICDMAVEEEWQGKRFINKIRES